MKKILLLLLVTIHLCNIYGQNDRAYIRKGNVAFRKNNYAQAEVFYKKALTNNATNAQALYNLGCALMAQQKYSLAMKNYELASKIEQNPKRKASVFHNMGVILQQSKMFDKAIIAYKESLRNNPLDDETRYNLELCKRQLKNTPKSNNDNNSNQQNEKKEDKDKKDKQDKNKKSDKENKDSQNKEKSAKQDMTKDNAEQLLNAVMQQEKETQERMKKAIQRPRSRNIEKNW